MLVGQRVLGLTLASVLAACGTAPSSDEESDGRLQAVKSALQEGPKERPENLCGGDRGAPPIVEVSWSDINATSGVVSRSLNRAVVAGVVANEGKETMLATVRARFEADGGMLERFIGQLDIGAGESARVQIDLAKELGSERSGRIKC